MRAAIALRRGLGRRRSALFAIAHSYPAAVTLLVLAGVFNIAFTSMAQTLVQLLAPPRVRGSVVGLFNTAMLGLRAGSGVTVGVLGAAHHVHWSLALSAAAVALIALALARDVRTPSTSGAAWQEESLRSARFEHGHAFSSSQRLMRWTSSTCLRSSFTQRRSRGQRHDAVGKVLHASDRLLQRIALEIHHHVAHPRLRSA